MYGLLAIRRSPIRMYMTARATLSYYSAEPKGELTDAGRPSNIAPNTGRAVAQFPKRHLRQINANIVRRQVFFSADS